jgi:hypothetical protein
MGQTRYSRSHDCDHRHPSGYLRPTRAKSPSDMSETKEQYGWFFLEEKG